MEKYKELIDGFYTSSLRWQRHEEDAPSLIYVRKEFDDWLTHLNGFIQRNEDDTELGDFLEALKQVVLDYKFQDKPVMVDGNLDLMLSRLRSDYRTGDPVLDQARGVDHTEELALDREHVLRIERIKLWDRVVRLIVDQGHKRAGSMSAGHGNDRLKWKGSIAEFEHIFSTLAALGYFDIPLKGGKVGERNNTAMARALMQCFDIRVDGKEITVENLRQRFSPGSPSKLCESKQSRYHIPGPGELVVPPSEGPKERS